MQFEPKTEEQVQDEQLCPEGQQGFTVLECVMAVSKSAKNAGKQMLKVKLNVHANDGYDYHVYDYVAAWFMAHKFRHFFFTCNKGALYESGQLPDAGRFVGATGYCKIKHQPAKDEFPAKATVADYIMKPVPQAAQPGKAAVVEGAAVVEEEDSMPF